MALAVNALLILALLGLVPNPTAPETVPMGPTIVDLLPDTQQDTTAGRTAERPRAAAEQRPRSAPQPRPVPPSEITTPDDAPATHLPGVMLLDKQSMASVDRTLRTAPGPKGDAPGEQVAGGIGDSETVGTAPGGELLYAADWQRRPTDAELSFYKPKGNARTGWGLIACRTAARYRVEDCVTLGESPQGSGFARSIQEAAWQFRVLPPRVGGRPLVGAWVRIRIDYTEREAG